MKMNLKVFRKGKPIYWIGGALILFVIFYLFFNRGSSGSTSTTVVASGPSENLQMAAMQTGIQTASIQAAAATKTAEIAAGLEAAGLAAQTRALEIQAGADVAKIGYEHDAAIAFANIDAGKAIAAMNYSYGIETAKIASESALAAKSIDASVLMYQLDTNKEMFKIQSDNLIAQSAIAAVSGPHVKEITRAPILMEALR